MWIALGRRLVLGASLASCLLAAPLEAQPAITALAPADHALLSSRSGTLTGRAASAVLVKVDGHELSLGGDGSFSYPFNLPEGESALSIYAEDAEGLSTSQVHHLEVDSLAPAIVITAPAQTRVAASPVDVAGTVQEPHLSGVTVRGSPASLSGNSFSASVSLTEGAQNVAVVATDSLGRSSTVTLVLTLDTQAPTIAVTEAGVTFTGGLFKRPVTPVIAISDGGGYTSEILLDGSPYVSGTAISSEGAHQLEITATDPVGNSASREIDFTLDFTAPTFGTISPASGALVSTSTVSLQVEATGATSVKVGSQQGSASGNVYTIGPISLSEGSQELSIEAFDAAGNRAERAHVLIRDTTAPALVVLAPAPNAVLTASPVTISGTATDPRLASVKVNGNLASLSGANFSLSQALSEGANSFEIVALDSAGNSSSQTLNLTLDTTAPSFTVKVGGVALAGGEVFSAAITPTIELSEPSATVTATLDGSPFTFGSAISADGNHQLSVTVTHNSLSSSNLFSFRIDRQSPVFGALLPAEGAVLAATSVLLEGTVTGAASLTVDGAAVTLDGGAFAAGPYTLTAGASRIFVLLARSAGGLTTERRLTVVQDSTAPQLAIQQPAENALLGTATVSVSGTATDPHLLRVRVSGVDAQLSASSWLASGISLAEGSNTLTVVAEDRAGNQRQLTRTVVRDTTDPEVTITEPAAGTVVPAASYTIRGTATDVHLDRVEVNGRRATLAGSAFSLEVTLAEGSNSFAVVAIDKLGRRASASVAITRDSAAPQVLIVEPEEGFATRAASITVRGAYENETGTTVKVNGIHAVLTSGHFEAAAIALAPGENRITARAVDAQGNAGVHTRVVWRDEVAPTFVRLEPAAGALALPLATVFRITFSEDMAAPAPGALTLATAAGSPLAFTATVEGETVVVTPSAPLPPQTALRLTLTAALTDRAGNALSPVPAAFEMTTIDTGAPGAPVLSATPVATACRRSVELTGTAEPLAQIQVTGGAAAAVARADEAGAFSLVVELVPEQTSVLHLTATDALGNVSPELLLSLGADCTPPQVADAQLAGEVVTVKFSEPVTTLSTAFRLASESGNESFTFALSGDTATLTLAAPPAGLLELAVGEPGGSAVTDLAGNTLAFPWRRLFGAGGGDSFLAGTVFDDGRGQPLEGVVVSVTSTDGVALADPLPRVTTTADGRFLLGLPAGTHDVTFARPGYSPVFRVVTTAAGQGTHVFDPRLTLLSLPKSIGAAGGEVVAGDLAAGGARLEVPSGAFASSQATSLTVLSEQALPSLLPYGFSPRGAVYANFDATLAVAGTLTLPVETVSGREVVIASLDFALLQWKALAVETVAGPTLEIEITQPGAYIVIEADAESASALAAVIGQVLPSLPAPEGDEIDAAEVDFSPTQVLPSQRSRATVSYTLTDPGTPAPSGLPLTLGVQERLTLLDGSERRAVPYSADLLVFRAPNGEPRSRFWLQPSALAASLPIEIGAEDVTVRTFGETTVRGNILGPDGGSVLGSDGDLFEVPAGALTKPTAVTVRRRSVGDLSHAAPAGFPVLGVLEVDLGGVQLAGIGRLTLATDDPPAAGSRGLLLGTALIDGEPEWRALAELEPISAGWRTVASGGSHPPWPGVRQGGLYLAIELEGDWGLLEGELYDTDQELVAGGLISSAAVPWIQLSNADGSYVIPLPAGSAVVVKARDTRRDQVSVEIPALDDLERRVFDLEVLATGPTVVEIEPADASANVPTTFLPRVVFSESIDRASLEEGIRLTRAGQPVAIEIDHQDDRIVIDPVASLLPDTSYTLEVGTEIADLQGRHLVAVRSVSFRTQAVSAPAPGIDASKLRLYEPDFEGKAKVVGLAGAVPADSTIWVESADTVTVVAENDGSFELEIPATLGDDLFLTVLVPGQSAAVQLLGPWLLRSGIGAFVDQRGGRFKTAAGFELEVQPGSFAQLTQVTLEPKPAPIPVSPRLTWVVDFELDLGGEVTQKPIYLRFPAPSSVPAGSTIFLSRFVEALGRRGWMVMDLLEKDGDSLTNALGGAPLSSTVAKAGGIAASRFENPGERVLPAASMVALRQGDYLPKAAGDVTGAARELEGMPQEAMEAAFAPSTHGQSIGLPGLRVSGRYQVAMTAQEVAWIRFSMKVWRHLSMVLGEEVAFFVVVVADLLRLTGIGELLAPRLADESVEIGMYDLTTGYEVYREVLPPTQEPIYTMPPGNYGDNQPPSIVDASPLRLSLIQTAAEGPVEVHSGISATVTGNQLSISGSAGSTAARAEIKLFDIDASPSGANLDKSVRSSEAGSFQIQASGFTPGKRFLLAIGGMVGPSERLTLRLSEVVPDSAGIEIFKVSEDQQVARDPVALSRTPLERGAAWQFVPVSGWRAGKYQLRLTNNFSDEAGNRWPRELTLEFEVPRSSSVGAIPVARFASFDRLANILAIAGNDGGLRLFDVSNPAEPEPFLAEDSAYRFPGGGSIRGVTIDSHGRILAVGSGEQFAGLLHVIDPLALDREAALPGAWTAGVWGHTPITNPLGSYSPFPRSGLPRRVAAMNLDRIDNWQVGEPAPLGLTSTLTEIEDSDEQTLEVTGTTEDAEVPVSLHNKTRGRWTRVESSGSHQFSISVRVRSGDAIELRRSRTSWAYVSVDGSGIVTVDVAGTRHVETDAQAIGLLGYTNGYRLDVASCTDAPNVNSTPIDLAVALADGEGGNESATLVTLVQGFGLALYQINPLQPSNLAELSSACAAVDRQARVNGMEVVSRYPMDLDGDGQIRQHEETTAQGAVKPRELRNYVVVAHGQGYVMIFDITAPATPKLVSRIKIGKPGEVTALSGVAVDRVNRKIYVGAFGSGLYAIDFNVLGGLTLQDADQDELDDRVTENIQVGDEELVDALAIPELGIIWGGGRRNGVAAIAVAGPKLKLITGEGAVLREVSRLAPLGVPSAPEGDKPGNPDYPGSFQAQVTVSSAAPELKIEVKSLGPTGLELPPARTDVEGLPATQLAHEQAIVLERQSENPWEAGSTLYLSKPVVVVADLRASVAYEMTDDESDACPRCDQVAENLYSAPPEPSAYLPELLSGHRVAVDWATEILPSLKAIYGGLLNRKVETPSVPWETSPAVKQEPALNASKGYGDVAQGTLLHSGEFSHEVTDLAIPGLGFDFVFTRTYRSQTLGNGPLGPGWDHNWNMHLRQLPNGDVELYDGRGRRDLVFTPDKTKYPQLRPSVGLRPHTQGFTLTDEKGNHFQFDRFGRLLAVVDPLKRLAGDTGSELTLSYDAESRLVRIEAHERGLDFQYDDDGRLEKLKDFSGRTWKYGYDSEGRLESVETPSADLGDGTRKSLKTRYTYVPVPNTGLAQKLAAFDDLDTIVDPLDVTTLDVGYQSVGSGVRTRVVSQVLGGGPGAVAITYAGDRTTVTDRRGKARHYDHDSYGHLTRFTDPLGNATQWTFTDFEAGLRNGIAKEVLLPDGRKTEFEHEQAVNPQPDLRRISNMLGIKALPTEVESSGDFPTCEGSDDLDPLISSFAGHSEEVNAPAEIVGPAGQKVTVKRDSRGVVQNVRSEASGTAALQVQMETDDRGLPTSTSTQEQSESSSRTVTTSSSYEDETGYLESESTTVGGVQLTTRYEHDERGNVTRVEAPGGIVSTAKFNELDWLLEECADVTGRNVCTRYEYDENGRPVRIEEPFGFGQHVASRIVYGSRGEIEQIGRELKPGGPELVETRTYDENLNLLESDPPALGKTVRTYDERGLVKTVQEFRGTNDPITTTYEYNSTSQLVSAVEGSRTWQITYDGLGRQKSVKDPAGTATFWKYDSNSKPIEEATCALDEEQEEVVLSKVTRDFDQAGRLGQEMTTAMAAGRSTETLTATYAYDNRSRLISAQDPSGVVRKTVYDEKGRVKREGHPLLPGGMVEYAYFDNQRRVESTATVGDQTVTSSVVYDGLGLPVSRTNGRGQTTTYQYDDSGSLRQMVLPDGSFFTFAYDSLGRLLTKTQPEGIEESYTYQDNADTRTETYRDAFGQATVSQYGKAGELLSVTYPDSQVSAWEYDVRGNPLKVQHPDGVEIAQTFDVNDRLRSRIRTEGDGPSTNEAYDWDKLGRPTLASVGGKTTTWQWDTASRLLQQGQGSRAVVYTPDGVGAPESTYYPSGQEVRRGYNGVGALGSVGLGSDPLASFSQQGAGLVSSSVGPLTGVYQYEAAGRVQRFYWNTTKKVLDEELTYDARGLPLKRNRRDLAQTWDYTYDDAARVTSAEQKGAPSSWSGLFNYEYDAAQNLLRKQRTSACGQTVTTLPLDGSGRNRPGSVSATELEWDARGRLVEKGDLRFEYDDRDRLTTVRRQLDEENTEVLATYEYDIEGRRVERQVGEVEIQTVWDGWQAIEDFQGENLVGQRVYGQGYDEILQLSLALGSGELSAYHPVYDSIGNMTALVRPNGDLVERYDYTPYGGRFVTANDHQPPRLEQIRLEGEEVRLQLSEPTIKAPTTSILAIQNLSREEQPILILHSVNASGRQHGRQVAFKNGGDPEDDPPTWPQPGDNVRIVVGADAFEDSFGNASPEYEYASVVWPGSDAVLVDITPPRLEEICSQGNTLKLTFSEPISATLAAAAIAVDGEPVAWNRENSGYTLTVAMPPGAHSLAFTTQPLDLAGLGLAQADSESFTTTGQTKSIYSAPFPGEAGDSLVGNPYGFQGLPQDNETGFLYVRNRYYDPELGRFITPDPMGYADGPNQYQFALNDPIVNRDPTGEIVETVWDVANIGMGLYSFYHNVKQGEFGLAAFDALGIVVDSAAALIPIVPGGVGAALKASRCTQAFKTANLISRTSDVAQGAGQSAQAYIEGNNTEAAIYAGMASLGAGGMFRKDPCNCFAAGTAVATESGFTPIEEIQIGDRVWSLNEASGEISLKPVVKTFVNENRPIYELDVQGADRAADTIEVTGEHPFWVDGQGWVAAEALVPGDRLRTNTVAWLEVLQLRGPPSIGTTYNFEVEDNHTYYVGQDQLLVHNQCPSEFARSLQGTKDYPGVDDFKDVMLKKGTVIYGGWPGPSNFFMAEKALRRSKLSARKLWRSLQVKPDPRFPNPVTGFYRPQVKAYRLTADIPVASARTLKNKDWGIRGGARQYVVQDDYLSFLEEVATIDLKP